MLDYTKSERLFLQFLHHNNIEYLDISKESFWFNSGVDFWIKYKERYLAIEIKEDSKMYKTGNIFFEFKDNHGHNGCLSRSIANELLYYDLHNSLFYAINMVELKRYVKNNKKDLRVTKSNEGATGYLIPIKNLINEKIAKVAELNVD